MMELIPSSSSSSSPSKIAENDRSCAVCGGEAKGMHFGAVSCRACAAFFRRLDLIKTIKPCVNDNKCSPQNTFRWAKCKKCRLTRCYAAGMSSEHFQFHRDLIGAKVLLKTMPKTMEQFIGRPHFVLACSPETISLKKDIIDCNPMFEKGRRIIEMGSESPIQAKNRLVKLAIGLQKVDEAHQNQVKVVHVMDQNIILSFFEKDFLKSMKWFTYLDEFMELDMVLQTTLMTGIWHAWTRLHKLAISAIGRRRGLCDKNMIMISHMKEYAVCDLSKIEVDMAWCSNYSNEQMKYFTDTTINNYIYQLADQMMDLKPNDVEVSFMMCELCFQYAGQRFQGEILEFCEKMQSLLADDLHNYYVKQLRTPNYAARLAKMIKINNAIREDICKTRRRQEIADVFNVYKVEFSNPEVFKDA